MAVCFMTLSHAQEINVPDPIFESYLEENGMGDGIPNNGLVLKENIENVTDLNIYSKGINDFTGLEGFNSLVNLYCSNNNPAELPLTLDLSGFTFLEKVICENNLVTSVIFPENSVLREANFNGNLMTAIDMSMIPEIVSLDIANNYLTSIDVTNASYLSFLNISNNSLTSLDVDNNEFLSILDVSYNQLTELSTHMNYGLQELIVNSNEIEELDLSDNYNLIFIEAPENKLTSLNLENLEYLIYLDLSSNDLNCLNIKSGYNERISSLLVTNNPNLSCIQADTDSGEGINTMQLDGGTSFNTLCEECQTVGTHEIELDHTFLSVYPNPCHDLVNVKTDIQNIESIQLTNLAGKVIKNYDTSIKELNVEEIPTGFYFLKVTNAQETISIRIIKG